MQMQVKVVKINIEILIFYENGLSLMYIIVFYHNFRCNFGSSTVFSVIINGT